MEAGLVPGRKKGRRRAKQRVVMRHLGTAFACLGATLPAERKCSPWTVPGMVAHGATPWNPAQYGHSCRCFERKDAHGRVGTNEKYTKRPSRATYVDI